MEQQPIIPYDEIYEPIPSTSTSRQYVDSHIDTNDLEPEKVYLIMHRNMPPRYGKFLRMVNNEPLFSNEYGYQYTIYSGTRYRPTRLKQTSETVPVPAPAPAAPRSLAEQKLVGILRLNRSPDIGDVIVPEGRGFNIYTAEDTLVNDDQVAIITINGAKYYYKLDGLNDYYRRLSQEDYKNPLTGEKIFDSRTGRLKEGITIERGKVIGHSPAPTQTAGRKRKSKTRTRKLKTKREKKHLKSKTKHKRHH